MRVVGFVAVLALGLAALALGGCSLLSGPGDIDGWRVGRPADCGAEMRCDLFVEAGVRGFERLEPEHAPIVDARLYEQVAPSARSGGPIFVVVIRVRDGSVHAVGVGNLGIERELRVFTRPGGSFSVP